MSDHQKKSPSGLKRLINCPGSYRLSDGIPSTSSKFAEEGTLAHEFAAHMLQLDFPVLPPVLDVFPLGSKLPDVSKDFSFTEDMLEAISVYLTYAVERNLGGGDLWLVEKRVSLAWLIGNDDCDGTADLIIGNFMHELEVVDYKHGRGVAVEVEDNAQGMAYALGALGPDNSGAYEQVRITIVQPRAPHVDGPIRSVVMPVEDLYRWGREVLLPAVRLCEEPNAPLCVGSWCQFCRAQAICPEMHNKAQLTAKTDFSVASPVLPSPKGLTMAELTRVLDLSGVLKSWLAEVEGHVQRLLEEGTPVPGYKLVEKRSNRKWKSEEDVSAALSMFYDDEIYAERKLKTPAQLEKLVGKDEVAALCEKPYAGLVIAPESDKRPAATRSAAALDFSKI